MTARWLATALLLVPVAASSQVNVKYDEFKKVTIVETVHHSATRTPRLELIAARDYVQKDPQGDHISMMFVCTSDEWRYLDCHELAALADGESVEIGKTGHDGDVGEGYVLEIVDTQVNLPTLTKFASAKEVKFRLCNTVIVLPADSMSELRQFVNALQQGMPGIASANPDSTSKNPSDPPAVAPPTKVTPPPAVLAKDKETEKLKLGATFMKNNKTAADILGMPEPKGVMILSVVQSSPAFRAGLLQGDVILKWGETEVNDVQDVIAAVTVTPAGSKVSLTIWRAEGKVGEKGRRGQKIISVEL